MFHKLRDKLNPSTLSGALDIIVVEHPDGSLRSSPWHLRFGKLGLIHHTDKVISVVINEQEAPFYMYVDKSGKGQFFASQSEKNTSEESISYPSVSVSPVKITAGDVRSLLNPSSPKTVSKSTTQLDTFLTRDSSVDLEASLDFEDPDPLPISTVHSSLDLAQSVHTKRCSDCDLNIGENSSSPVPSALLLQTIRPWLQKGRNMVTFTVSSLIQGPKTIIALLYLWTTDIRVVISDVDGTVTSSDLLGHVLPSIGRDWTHPGLARLYSSIAIHGLQFLYLSSRPIGEAPLTRKTLQMIEQDGFKLPDGPLITCPDRMIPAITREVVLRKPHEFKIPTLQAICDLFTPYPQPFVFGFGNRKTDVMSYTRIGLPEDKILLFDTHHKVLDSNGKELYPSISSIIRKVPDILGDSIPVE